MTTTSPAAAQLLSAPPVPTGCADWLAAINRLRCGWGVPPLSWNASLASEALLSVETCAPALDSQLLFHAVPTPSGDGGSTFTAAGNEGQTLYFDGQVNGTGVTGATRALNAWTAQEYNYSCPADTATARTLGCTDASSVACLSFRQLVSRTTTAVGCAIAAPCGGAFTPTPLRFVACRFYPLGNVVGVTALPSCACLGSCSCATTSPPCSS